MFFYLSTRVCIITICLPFSEQQQRLGSPQIGKLLSENFSFTVPTYKHTYTLHTITHTCSLISICLKPKRKTDIATQPDQRCNLCHPCPSAAGSHFWLVLWFVQLFLKVSLFDRGSCFSIVWFLLSIKLIRGQPPEDMRTKNNIRHPRGPTGTTMTKATFVPSSSILQQQLRRVS